MDRFLFSAFLSGSLGGKRGGSMEDGGCEGGGCEAGGVSTCGPSGDCLLLVISVKSEKFLLWLRAKVWNTNTRLSVSVGGGFGSVAMATLVF